MTEMPTFPFEAALDDILRDPEPYVDAVFSCLESEFLVMPKGAGFIDYPVFERGYEALKAATNGFSLLDPKSVMEVAASEPISIVVPLHARFHTSRVGIRHDPTHWNSRHPGICEVA